MALTHRLFGIRSCNEVITGARARPCLEYDIRRCIAPCVREICSEETYATAVRHTRLFLEGRNDELVTQLTGRMTQAASEERYEEAAQLRDALRTIETLQQRQQKMAGTGLGDRDAFGIKAGPAGAVVQVFQVRGGKVIERIELASSEVRGARREARSGRREAPASESEGPAAGSETEILQAAVEQFYLERAAPPEIHLPFELNAAETETIQAWLTDRSEHRVRMLVPKRGEKRGLLDLAARNAQVAYQTRFNETVAAHYDALETLRVVLNLPAIPRRIECFDISTIQGSETVASMVVCEDGRMKRGEYRKYRIRGVRGDRRVANAPNHPETAAPASRLAPPASQLAPRASGIAPRIQDDFASIHEVVQRRYRKVLENGGPFPDLILIDGGKGQLSAAYAALESLGLANLVAVGIAKKEELLFTREHVEPMDLGAASPALLLIQRIRDEAHRFAITFHRQSRARRDLRSELDDVPGIGPRRRKALLTAFGSLAGVRRATREDLIALVGAKCADQVLAYFAGQP
jgi:excinuclease ABC subunit C